MASWFNNIKALAEQISNDIAQNINNAQNDMMKEQQSLREEELRRQQRFNDENVVLPWETCDESKTILTQSLMEEVLALSLMEQNFLVSLPEPKFTDTITFHFESFVPTALKLMKLDANLAHMHMKLSPKMSEEMFWKNYYHRIIFLRIKSGVESNLELYKIFENIKSEDIIFTPSSYPILTNPSIPTETDRSKSNNDDINVTKIMERRAEQAHLAAEVEAELDGSIDDIFDDDIDAELEKEFEDLDDGYEDLGDEFDTSCDEKYKNESSEIKNKRLEEQIELELSSD